LGAICIGLDLLYGMNQPFETRIFVFTYKGEIMKNLMSVVASFLMLVLLSIALFGFSPTVFQADSFWTEAAQGGTAEVMLSETALQRSQNEEVRAFAQQMITDHTAANNELKQLATTKSITLPASVNTKQQATLTKLNSMSGADFDREYMKTMVKDHEKMVKLFEKTSERATDTEAKTFAGKTLPSLQSHLTAARNINDRIRANSNGNGRSNGETQSASDNSGSNRNDNSGSRSNSNRRSNSNMNTNSNNN
jgi:putative membrane protein